MDDLNRFLSYFDDPLAKIIPMPGGSVQNVTKYQTLDYLLDMNGQTKSHLYFHPNGRFAKTNKLGEQLSCKESDIFNEGAVSAFVLDFDRKLSEYDTQEDYTAYLKMRFEGLNYKPSILVESGGGLHAYWIIKKEDRKRVREMRGKEVFEIPTEMAFRLGADMQCQSTKGFGLIRLPYSINYKYEKPFTVRIIEEHADRVITFEDIETSFRYLEKNRAINKQEKSLLRAYPGKFSEAEKIPMPNLLEKLNEKPRKRDGKKQLFNITSDNRVVITTEDGSIIADWNSYRYNRADNYIHCFYEGDMVDAPEGCGIGFLYRYFDKNIDKAKAFLLHHFNITFDKPVIQDVGITINEYTYQGMSLFFCTNGVKIDKPVIKKSGEAGQSVEKVIFKDEMQIVARGKTKQSILGDATAESECFIIKIKGVEHIVPRKHSKSTRNKEIPQAFFYGMDDDLGDFFTILSNADDIPEVQVIEKSGFYDHMVVVGTEVMYADYEYEDGGYRIFNKYNTIALPKEEKKEIPLTDYLEKFRECYDDEIVYPIFYQTIALAGMNIRSGRTTYPGLLISGLTGTGKSKIAEAMKTMIGYEKSCRKFSLPGITPQPFKEALCDNSILFLEELTQNVRPEVEELTRNALNHDVGAVGTPGRNFEFHFHSPLLVCGERMFKDESINNRFMIIVMDRSYRKVGTKQQADELIEYTAAKDMYQFLFEQRERLNGLIAKWAIDISKQYNIDSRYADTRSYIFAVNECLGYTQADILAGYMKKHVHTMGGDTIYSDSPLRDLKDEIAALASMRKIIASNVEDDNTMTLRFTFVDTEELNKKRGTYIMLLNKINKEIKAECENVEDPFFIDNRTIGLTVSIMRCDGKFSNPVTQVLEAWISDIIHRLPNKYDVNSIVSTYF